MIAFLFITLLGAAPAQGKAPESGPTPGALRCIEEAFEQAERSWLAEMVDQDRDGELGEGEITTFVEREFEAADSDGDGSLTPAEYAAAWLQEEAGTVKDPASADEQVHSAGFSALTLSDYERDYAAFTREIAEETGRHCDPTAGEISAIARVEFSSDDRDADGLVTQSELDRAEQAELTEEFGGLDGDRDGRLSRAESLAALRAHLLELED